MFHRLPDGCSGLVRWGVFVGAVAMSATAPVLAQQGAADGEWHAFAGDNGATKYSPLDQINADNVGDLRIAYGGWCPVCAECRGTCGGISSWNRRNIMGTAAV